MDADLELQGAIVQALKGDAAVTALVGQRVYDIVPDSPQFPYLSFGPSDVLEEDYDCISGQDISIQLDAWSRSVGFPEVKRIRDAVRVALHDADLQLAVNALVMIEHRHSIATRDPDGLTSHVIMDFTAWVERK